LEYFHKLKINMNKIIFINQIIYIIIILKSIFKLIMYFELLEIIFYIFLMLN